MRQFIRAAFSAMLVSTILLTPVFPAIAAAVAPASGVGWLKAESNGAGLPPGSSVALELEWDSGAPNGGSLLAIARDAARRALIAKGYSIDPNSAYVFQINIDMPEFSKAGGNDERTEWPDRSDQAAIPQLRDQLRIPLGRAPVIVPATIALETTVFNRRGDVLWVATTEAAYNGNDPESLMRHMVSATVAVVGADAERSFALTCEGNRKSSDICLG